MNKDVLWTEKYRPKTIDECILPAQIKNAFCSYVMEKQLPNLILAGSPGVGKTSVAIAALLELDADYLKINSSLKRGMDVIRDEMMEFAMTVSLKGGRKYILLDEADGILPDSQRALNAFIEEYARNCGFIFTCNRPNKIISTIHSRCELIKFKITKEEFPTLGKEFYLSLKNILITEGVSCEKPVLLSEVIKKFYPDWRKMLNVVQSYVIQNNKVIDTGILSINNEVVINEIIPLLRRKDWQKIRVWVGENFSLIGDFAVFASTLFKLMEPHIEAASCPNLYLLMNMYDDRSSRVADQEVNLVAFLTEVMNDIIFK